MGDRRSGLALLAVVLSGALTACGSTVQLTSSSTTSSELGGTSGTGGSGLTQDAATSGSTTGLGTSAGGSTGSSTGLGSTGNVGSSGSSGTSGTSGSSGSSGTSTTGSTPVPSTRGANGLGVTDKTISIGFGYSDNGQAANSTIGGGSLTTGDDLANAKAVIADINEHGGIAGRKVIGVFHAYDNTSAQPGTAQDQAACSAWIDDAKVIAVIGGNLTDVLPACLKKAGITFLKIGALVGEDKEFLREYPNEFLLGTLTQDRYLADVVSTFQRQKYFTGWNTVSGAPANKAATVAVMTYDATSFSRAVKNVLLPKLKGIGHPVQPFNVYTIHKPASQSDVGGTTAQIKNATLSMQQNGVTHVVFNDGSGLLMGLFATNARSQGYYPRFGITSGAGPQGIYDAGLVQARQLVGMSGNGWLPSIDLPAADGSKYATAATKRCLKILKDRTGQTYDSTNAASIALGACDGLFAITQALKQAPALSPVGLIKGLESLGGSFDSPILPRFFLSPTQHDSAIQGYDQNWVPSCTCVRYSTPHDIP
jgi:ABC-type branched-subunit amino acid transport system substrate-binding protein